MVLNCCVLSVSIIHEPSLLGHNFWSISTLFKYSHHPGASLETMMCLFLMRKLLATEFVKYAVAVFHVNLDFKVSVGLILLNPLGIVSILYFFEWGGGLHVVH